MLTAYFDESGTHASSPTTVMAGVLGDAEQWARFRRDLSKVKMKYGFNVFHAKEFRARSGCFSGWSREKCADLCLELARITAGKFIDSVEFVLDNDKFEREYRREKRDRKLVLDTKYALCFRQCALYFVLIVVRKFGGGSTALPNVHLILEDGHKNAGDAVRVFGELGKECAAHGCNILEKISFANKKCDELMVPDFLAYMSLSQKRNGTPATFTGSQNQYPLGGWPGDGLDITHLEFKPNGLAEIRDSLETTLEKRRRFWKGDDRT